jgi:hypothetical protein
MFVIGMGAQITYFIDGMGVTADSINTGSGM